LPWTVDCARTQILSLLLLSQVELLRRESFQTVVPSSSQTLTCQVAPV